MIDLTPALIAQACGARYSIALQHTTAIVDAMRLYEIDATPARAGMFLANIGHETMRLTRFSEIWGPTPQQLRYERDFTQPWPSCPVDARRPEYHRNALAYNLGNVSQGDGRLFPGHGMLHTTGRFNHGKVRDRLRARFPQLSVPDFEQQPHLLMDPRWGALAAGDYVDMKGANAMADAGDFDGYCDLINRGRKTDLVGDTWGWQERLALWKGIQEGEALA